MASDFGLFLIAALLVLNVVFRFRNEWSRTREDDEPPARRAIKRRGTAPKTTRSRSG